ncbi:MAG TPA: helix-turn-helix domain-containing protein [Xanthobacteraceae bacterium]|nr:helix-turn-helix domain-containing protein [Xanthobacteraceae bacterium]
MTTAPKPATAAALRAHYRAVRSRLNSPSRSPSAPLRESPPQAATPTWSTPATPVEAVVFRRTGCGRALAESNERLRALFATGRRRERELIDLVTAHFGVTRAELVGARGTARVAQARHFAMYLCRRELGASTTALGRLFRRDPSTVCQASLKVAARVAQEPALAAEIADIITRWREGEP